MRNIVIIGGMAAGCTAAARLSRLSSECEVTIVEKGSYVSVSRCGLHLYAGGDLDDVSALSRTAYGVVRDENYFRGVKGITVLLDTEAVEVDTADKKVSCRNVLNGKESSLRYDSLLISTGAEPVKPDFPCADSPMISSFHFPSDAQRLRDAVQEGKIRKAAIIGGGIIACELMEAMTTLWGIDTTLIDNGEGLLSSNFDKEISLCLQSSIDPRRIHFMLGKHVDRIEIGKSGIPVVHFIDEAPLESDYVVYSIGVKHDSDLARKSNIEIGEHGGVLVNMRMRTNVPDIWAAGDCVETRRRTSPGTAEFPPSYAQANSMGRVAANSIMGIDDSYRDAMDAIAVRLFDNVICAAGLTEQRARELGCEVGSVVGCWSDKPEYNSEGKVVFGKLTYEKPGLKVLGLQLMGEGELVRYIDLFMELLKRESTVVDLAHLEHVFVPAHSNPFSPLNHLGFLALDQERDGICNVNPISAQSFNGTVIDVREESEVASLPFPGECIHVPMSSIRSKFGAFSSGQALLFACSKGPRGYEAARLFRNHGHKNVSYLGGGIVLYNKILHDTDGSRNKARAGT